MKCPLCAHEGIDEQAAVCPACNADLTAYKSLEKIQGSLKRQRMMSLVFIMLFIIALLACVAIFLLAKSKDCSEAEQKLQQCEMLTTQQSTEIGQLQQQIAELKSENTRLQDEMAKAPATKSITYLVREGETLYGIARNFYGDGKLYTKIAQDNGISNPDLIIAGDTIIIKL